MNRFTKGAALIGRMVVGNGGLRVGPSTAANLKAINYGTLSIVHGTILPAAIGTVSVALAGLAAADIVQANPVALTAGVVYGGVTPVAGTLKTYVLNPSAGTIAPGTFSLTYAQFDLT